MQQSAYKAILRPRIKRSWSAREDIILAKDDNRQYNSYRFGTAPLADYTFDPQVTNHKLGFIHAEVYHHKNSWCIKSTSNGLTTINSKHVIQNGQSMKLTAHDTIRFGEKQNGRVQHYDFMYLILLDDIEEISENSDDANNKENNMDDTVLTDMVNDGAITIGYDANNYDHDYDINIDEDLDVINFSTIIIYSTTVLSYLSIEDLTALRTVSSDIKLWIMNKLSLIKSLIKARRSRNINFKSLLLFDEISNELSAYVSYIDLIKLSPTSHCIKHWVISSTKNRDLEFENVTSLQKYINIIKKLKTPKSKEEFKNVIIHYLFNSIQIKKRNRKKKDATKCDFCSKHWKIARVYNGNRTDKIFDPSGDGPDYKCANLWKHVQGSNAKFATLFGSLVSILTV